MCHLNTCVRGVHYFPHYLEMCFKDPSKSRVPLCCLNIWFIKSLPSQPEPFGLYCLGADTTLRSPCYWGLSQLPPIPSWWLIRISFWKTRSKGVLSDSWHWLMVYDEFIVPKGPVREGPIVVKKPKRQSLTGIVPEPGAEQGLLEGSVHHLKNSSI